MCYLLLHFYFSFLHFSCVPFQERTVIVQVCTNKPSAEVPNQRYSKEIHGSRLADALVLDSWHSILGSITSSLVMLKNSDNCLFISVCLQSKSNLISLRVSGGLRLRSPICTCRPIALHSMIRNIWYLELEGF